MNKITKYVFFILAIALVFGSFNPLDLRGAGRIYEQIEEQRGFTPFLFAGCIGLSLFDKKVVSRYSEFKTYYIPLLFLLLFYWLSSIIFDFSTATDYYMFFAKLSVAITGFVVFSMYFTEYPQMQKIVCRIFALVCAGVCLMFFMGLLDGFYFFSQGRLWLFGENPNSYSFVIGFGALILGKEMSSDYNIFYRLLCALGILLILTYIYMSGSRGTIIFLCFSFFIVYADFVKNHLVLSIIILVGGVVVVGYLLSRNVENLSMIDRISELRSGDERESLMQNALTLFFDSPLYGYGVNGYEYMKRFAFYDIRDSHNMIVSILATSGLLGFCSIMVFYKRVVSLLFTDIHSNHFPIALFLYVFLISMKTGGIITYAMMWFAYAIVVSLCHQNNQSIER